MANMTYEDKVGQQELFNKKITLSDSDDISDSDEESEMIKPSSSKLSSCWNEVTKIKSKRVLKKKKDEDDIDEDDIYVDLGKPKSKLDYSVRKMADQDELLKDTVITPDFNRRHEVPTIELSENKAKKERKKEREKTTGSKWFNMPAPEMTEELSKDLEVIKMRAALDPKQFYKKNTMSAQPKYFQIGRIVESSADFFHSRVAKKDRKKTLVDELLADAEFKKYNKRRYAEIIVKRKQTDRKALNHAKRLKKKK